MSSASASPDSNPTRAQLQLVVLGQWVLAGLALARGAGTTGRGLIGGAVALWRVWQAVRLAMQLAQRLSDAHRVLAAAAFATAPGGTAARSHAHAQGSDPLTDDLSGPAACLRHALAELISTIRDALGRGPDRRVRFEAGQAARAGVEPELAPAPGRLTPPRERPPDRPPPPERRRARRRRSCAPPALNRLPTPIAVPAIGRLRLAAG